MDKSEMWDLCAPDYENTIKKLTGPCVVKLLEELAILPVLPSASPIKAIDLAAGPGILATILGEAYSQAGQLDKLTILSTDFSPKMVELAQRQFNSHNWSSTQFSARTLNATNLVDVASDYYTHAFCAFGLFMIPNASKAVEEIFRVLQPSGMIGITTWHKIGWLPIVSECIARAKMISTEENNAALAKTLPSDWPDTSYVQKALENAGFQNVQVNICDARFPFANHDDCVQILVKAPWLQPFLKKANLTDEQRETYNQVAPQVLLDIVGKDPNQPFDLPMVAIIAHGQKPGK